MDHKVESISLKQQKLNMKVETEVWLDYTAVLSASEGVPNKQVSV